MKRIPESGAMDDPKEVESYNRLSSEHLKIVEENFVRRAAVLLGKGAVRKKPLVLDVGAGPGNIPAALAGKIPEALVVAADLSPGMLKTARKRFAELGLETRALTVCAHSEHLPFRNGQFDMVYTHSTLHHLPDPAATLNEISRATAPGGRFLVRDLRRPPAGLIRVYLAVFGARYDSLMKKMYLESLQAGYTFREMRGFARGIAGAAARARRFFVTHVGIEGRRLDGISGK